MRFALDTEQHDFAASIDAAMAAADVPSAVRAWAAGDTTPGRKVWQRLAELGVTALAVPEAGKRDIRRQSVQRAITSLAKRKEAPISIERGRVIICV